MLIYYKPTKNNKIILKSKLQSKSTTTYTNILKNINISNLNSNITLYQIKSIKKIYNNNSQK